MTKTATYIPLHERGPDGWLRGQAVAFRERLRTNLGQTKEGPEWDPQDDAPGVDALSIKAKAFRARLAAFCDA